VLFVGLDGDEIDHADDKATVFGVVKKG